MSTESRLGDLSKSLASGFFADRVVKFLVRHNTESALDQEGKALAKRVREFFESVLKGVRWPSSPDLSYDSVSSVELYKNASTVKPGYDRSQFDHYITELGDITARIEKRKATEKEIQQLTFFFRAYRKALADRAEMVYLRRERSDENVMAL